MTQILLFFREKHYVNSVKHCDTVFVDSLWLMARKIKIMYRIFTLACYAELI